MQRRQLLKQSAFAIASFSLSRALFANAPVTNLFIPVCLSSSHIAYGSIRMEPVFMVLGQSAAIAASIAIDKNVQTQEVFYPELRAALINNHQILK